MIVFLSVLYVVLLLLAFKLKIVKPTLCQRRDLKAQRFEIPIDFRELPAQRPLLFGPGQPLKLFRITLEVTLGVYYRSETVRLQILNEMLNPSGGLTDVDLQRHGLRAQRR